MIWFILALLMALAGVAAIAASVVGAAKSGGYGVILIAVGALSMVSASASSVPTRNVGIVTAFNKPTGETTGAGLQWHKPWESVDDWDASGNTYDRLGDRCLWVSIAAQRRACVPVQVEWNSRADRAPENWAAYKEVDGIDGGRFGTFVARRVTPQIDAAITSAFAGFDPLGTVNADTGDAPAPDLNKTFKQSVQTAIEAALGRDIEIRSVAFGTPRYDDPTTAQIAAYGQKVLEARNLEIDEANAAARKRIAAGSGVSPTEQLCLTVADKHGKEPGLCLGSAVALTRPIG